MHQPSISQFAQLGAGQGSIGQLLQGSLLTEEARTNTAHSKEHLEEVRRIFQTM